ncbi:MAG: hypothetical protein JWO89_1722, partial [Verrucomicrobiaceae bacterium]|nr:hypothetical protein [Verrucomicrobiaceae bacterium]
MPVRHSSISLLITSSHCSRIPVRKASSHRVNVSAVVSAGRNVAPVSVSIAARAPLVNPMASRAARPQTKGEAAVVIQAISHSLSSTVSKGTIIRVGSIRTGAGVTVI